MIIEIKDSDVKQLNRIFLEAQNYVYGRKLECFGSGNVAWKKWNEEYEYITKIGAYVKEQIRKQNGDYLI